MIKLLKYLKPYIAVIVCSVVLLFVQANAELALPDYMSRIVNVGIQQGGVEDKLPAALRAEMYETVLLFLDADSASAVNKLYGKVEPDAAASDQKEQWPLLETESLYILNSDGIDYENSSVKEFQQVFLAMYAMESGVSMGAGDSAAATPGMDILSLPEGTDKLQFLRNLPAEQLSMISAMMTRGFESMDPAMLTQAVYRGVKAEYILLGVDAGKMQSLYILMNGGIMMLLTLLSAVATILVGLIAARVAASSARSIRRDLFCKVESFSAAEFDKFSTASLITRTTNDITQVQTVTFMIIRMVVYAPIMGIGGVIRAVGKAPSMAWLIGIAVLFLLGMIGFVMVIALPRFKIIQKLTDRLNLVARENLSGMLVVRAFNRQKFEEERFDSANRELTRTNLFIIRVMVFMMPIIMLVMNLLTVVIIWVGAHQIADATMQVGDMMAFIQYAMQIIMSFLMLSMMFIFIPRASVSGARIAEVLETEPSIKDPVAPQSFTGPVSGKVEFRNVSFRYPGGEEDAVCGLNFTAHPGKTTAIIGSTGSGKSTLVNLIPRFYDVTSGEILLDGVDIRNLSQHELREQIGYVPQRSTLFSGTIASNLRYASESATDDTLLQAVKTAQAEDFISEREEGLDSSIAQGGSNVSGGQKQRLSIARALVHKYPVFIFDDSFSALDFQTDLKLRKALKDTTGESALIIVAQRVATIMQADQILVLDEGQVVGTGTHRELLESCETYKEIALSQLSLEELA